MGNIEQILSELIKFKTDKEETSNKPIVDYISSILEKHNLEYVRLKNKKTGLESIVASINCALKESEPTLFLSGHMDTVVTNAEGWKVTKPLEPLIKDGKVYGLGAADMKSAIAVYLDSIEAFKQIGSGIILSFTNDEETDIESIKDVMIFLKKNNIHPKFGFLGEPTDNQIAIRSTGYMGFKTTVFGPAGHSTQKNKATPIYVAAQIILFIERMYVAYRGMHTSFHVGTIKGGECRNSLPTSAEFDWEMRFVKKGPAAVGVKQILELHREIRDHNEFDVRVKTYETIPSYVEGPHTELVKTLRKILPQSDLYQLTYATEAGYIKRYGMKTVILGPGKEENAHAFDEYVEIENLYKYQDILLQFLKMQKNKNKPNKN